MKHFARVCGSLLLLAGPGVIEESKAANAPAGVDAARTSPIVWRFDSLTIAGSGPANVLGAPKPVRTERRPALVFNGVSDGLIFSENPLRAQRTFTIEVLFRPDHDGPAAQRFVHVEDTAENRALIETRLTDNRQWCLDTFLYSKPRDRGVTLIDNRKLHPTDRWYWAALVYDGTKMSHFVNAAKELDGTIEFGPMGEGRTSVGVRLNQVFWFKGAIAELRFHSRPLAAPELQRLE